MSFPAFFRDRGWHDHDYLGDGVYCAFDGHQIWLAVEREDGVHHIALEPDVLHALNNYAIALKAKYTPREPETRL